MTALKKIVNAYNKIEEVLLVVMITASVLVLFINVILRYIFNSSLYGADELARVLFIWMSWLGISIGERESEHIKIDLLTSRLKGISEKVIKVISNLITLTILALLVWFGLVVVGKYYAMSNRTPMYHIPQWFIYSCIPVSCTVMGLRVIAKFIEIFKPASGEEVSAE